MYLGVNKYGDKAFCHYIPIKETLRSLFQNECVVQQYENPIKCEDSVLKDIVDGSVCHTNNFIKDNSNCLKIILFQDAFEIVNPLGSAKKKHKLLGVYFTLANFYPHNRSSVAQTQLVLLGKEADCRHFGDDKVFGRLISDLKDLEANGIQVANDIGVKGLVVCIAGDNLGSHYIGGFVESFCAEYMCRYCLATRCEVSAKPFTGQSLERNRENYSAAVEFLDSNPTENSHEGIKRDSVFNELTYFHVTSGLPPCVAHDLFEGLLSYDLALCVRYFVRMLFFLYDILNGRIKLFPFCGSDAANKPAEVPPNGDRIGGQAVQNWTLLRYFGLIIGDKIPNSDDAVWQFVLLMQQMTALICAPSLSYAQVAYMRVLIEEYLESRTTLFGEVPLRPKHHFLSHYPSLTLKFGPLIRLWTMRFESKHSYFKQCMRSAQNYKNVTGMLAERHQLYQAYQLTGNFFCAEVELRSSTPFHADLYCKEVQDTVTHFSFTSENTVVCDSVCIKGNSFGRDSYVLAQVRDETALYCVLLVLVKQLHPHFVARKLDFCVVNEIGALKIVDDDGSSMACFEATHLTHDYPLCVCVVRGGRYIVPKSAALQVL